ncbi:hypothetical protein J7E97_16740 [Streptomyces sp. ISL-66]|uniref:hypothetical protein n=1 Tax=Streptomyces sp. ISL-66 TaxID=2819186 RepID=UPI001BE828E8|nr:hypothetical protein [Streptomyces sp. ISL-66]MBT2469479.1 hypothetical protein [Streptomyces sp. ISL-66]
MSVYTGFVCLALLAVNVLSLTGSWSRAPYLAEGLCTVVDSSVIHRLVPDAVDARDSQGRMRPGRSDPRNFRADCRIVSGAPAAGDPAALEFGLVRFDGCTPYLIGASCAAAPVRARDQYRARAAGSKAGVRRDRRGPSGGPPGPDGYEEQTGIGDAAYLVTHSYGPDGLGVQGVHFIELTVLRGADLFAVRYTGRPGQGTESVRSAAAPVGRVLASARPGP